MWLNEEKFKTVLLSRGGHFTNCEVLRSVTYRFREFHFPYMGIGNIDYIHSIKRLELLAFILTSYKIFKTCFQIKDILFFCFHQKQVVYAHIRKVKFPKTICHTSEYLTICIVIGSLNSVHLRKV